MLHALGQDIRLVMPAYREAKSNLLQIELVATFTLLEGEVNLLEATLPESELTIWLVDCPALFDREAGPYLDSLAQPWADNAQRFALFSRAIVAIATNSIGLNWQPDIVHCNDWQTGLVPALLHLEVSRPGIIFTIHNMAYQGIFPHATFSDLQLPDELWSMDSLEFHDQLSFIKGGIVYADYINTVSPTYAKEIQTTEYGFGFEDILKNCSHKVFGIINGVNLKEWSPNNDSFIDFQYDAETLERKTKNKLVLQEALGFTVAENIPLLGVVSRLVEQKGTDIIIKALALLNKLNLQLVILGEGDKTFEQELNVIAYHNPSMLHVHIGYDEGLAHKITAGADIFLMPSRFEPCGLNQMYSQIYGTVPLVRRTGGLADTVVNHTKDTLPEQKTTGFVFEHDTVDEFVAAVTHALKVYHNKDHWRKIQLNGMRQDFTWEKSAMQYLDLYSLAISNR